MVNDIRKFMNLFEDQNEDEIRSLLNEYFDIIGQLLIRNGLVDVTGSITLKKPRGKIPVKFASVSNRFDCSASGLKSLEGCPNFVGGNFNCSNNILTSLIGGPLDVNGSYFCQENQLTSLEGCPQYIGGTLYCNSNNLTSFKGCPDQVMNIDALNNPLVSLEGLTKGVKEIAINWNEDLPLLRLLQCNDVEIQSNDNVDKIISKYCLMGFSRANLIQCQKELIENGFEGNAKW